MPNQIKTVNFGSAKTGLTTVGYTLYNTDGTTKQARTTTGVGEIGSSGIYYCNISFDSGWQGIILWDTGEGTPRYAGDVYINILDETITGHTTADTLAQRIQAIFKERHSGGGSGIVTSSTFNEEEKKRLWTFLDATFKRVKEIQESFLTVTDQVKNSLIKSEEQAKLLIKEIQSSLFKINTDIIKISNDGLNRINSLIQKSDNSRVISNIAELSKKTNELITSEGFSKKFLSERNAELSSVKLELQEYHFKFDSKLTNKTKVFLDEIQALKKQIQSLLNLSDYIMTILVKEASTETLEELSNVRK